MAIKKILIVDDSPTDRHMLSVILTRGGYQVGFANSGEDGVAMSKAGEPDLVLMDVVMPGLNGFEATRLIVKDKATMHIPIIICSTKCQPTDKIWGLRQGAKDYVTKPVVAEELLRKISQLN